MFGLGFTEILIIAVIAILFLGPDKLPSAMVEVAKFFRTVKKTMSTVKDSLEQEMNVADIKEEALAYKKELLKANESLHKATNLKQIAADLTNLNDDTPTDKALENTPKSAPKEEKVTFEKKIKEEKTDV